jgi:hypothetical protein
MQAPLKHDRQTSRLSFPTYPQQANALLDWKRLQEGLGK